MNTLQVKTALRGGKYAWPGGYPLYFITDDGEALSFDAVKNNWYQVCYSMRHNLKDGWGVIGVDVNWEDPGLYCADTNELIECAYCD